MLKITAYTDGSCLGNPGVGGYAGVMIANGKKRRCCGYSADKHETNQRMELKALICVLDWLNRIQKQPCVIEFCVDNKTIIDCSKHSDYSLMAPERKNNDLWIEYIQKRDAGKHTVTFTKVPAHSDCEFNNEADTLAKSMAKKARFEAFGG